MVRTEQEKMLAGELYTANSLEMRAERNIATSPGYAAEAPGPDTAGQD